MCGFTVSRFTQRFWHFGGARAPPKSNTMAAPAALTRSAATEAHLLQKANHDQQQLKTFSRWWASELPEGIGLDNLVDGLKSGVAGITLIERLTGKPIDKRWHSEPGGNRVKMMENQSIFLARLKELGVHLVNISAEDIVDGRQTIVLGLTWKLITHFSEGLISDAGASDLHEWLKRNIQSQGVELTSWSDSSMKNGMALCALIHAYDPTALKLASVQPSNALENVELALTVAHERFGAPRLVDAADVVGDEDVKSLQTYCLKLKQALRRHAEGTLDAAAEELTSLEAATDNIVEWSEKQVANMNAQAAAVAAKKSAAAVTPEARRGVIEYTEGLHAVFEKDFRGKEKQEILEVKADVVMKAERVGRVFAEDTAKFDHGQELSLPANTSSDGATTSKERASVRLNALVARVESAWRTAEAAESEYERMLLSVLTNKATDIMMASAEADGLKVGQWIQATKVALEGARIRNADASTTTEVSASSDALAKFSVEVVEHDGQLASIRAAMLDVAKRRADEGREAAPTSWLDDLGVDWQALIEVASALRRDVAGATKFHAEQVDALTAKWSGMASGLRNVLPDDPELIEPAQGFCLVM